MKRAFLSPVLPAPILPARVLAGAMLTIAALGAAPLAAVPGGELGTLELGDYVCEMPGDASGPVGRPLPAYDFSVISASSYIADGRIGSYLLIGDELVMTSGARQGLRFLRKNRGLLKLAAQGTQPAGMRCVLAGHSAG